MESTACRRARRRTDGHGKPRTLEEDALDPGCRLSHAAQPKRLRLIVAENVEMGDAAPPALFGVQKSLSSNETAARQRGKGLRGPDYGHPDRTAREHLQSVILERARRVPHGLRRGVVGLRAAGAP